MITEVVEQAVRRTRKAQSQFARSSQTAVDDLVAAVGWAGYQEDAARHIARFSHAETGLGDPDAVFVLQCLRVLGCATWTASVRRDRRGRSRARPGQDREAARGDRRGQPRPGPGILCNVLPMLKTRNAVVFTALFSYGYGQVACSSK
ncbi:hypothetical protein ACFQ78_41005 [Streptomyces sp. NPDC056519]|uniref:hypothetical protein n=1 Tax=Streptomyces sp. NPDC056519 TaxID=3345849 RepID=UPI003681A4B0